MNYADHFEKIKSFLSKHKYIYEVEILKRYPDDIDSYYMELSKDLKGLSDEEFAQFESEASPSEKYSKNLNELLSEIKSLIDLEDLDIKEAKLDQNLKRKLNPKKLHELSTLKTYFDEGSYETLYDIGGGIGHLSNIFVHSKVKSAHCIDMNKEFQEAGKRKLARWLKENIEKVSFINKEVRSDLDLNLTDKTLLAGLHSCGSLSNDLIDCYKYNKKGGLLNFGCCYHKLEDHYNLSQIAKENPLTLTNNALHLATRSYAYTNEKDVMARRKVKSYRYALHHLGMKYFDDGFFTLGNGKGSDYDGSFSDYVYKYYPKAKGLSQAEIENFYESFEVQEKINENFCLDFIRGLFGRVIEMYLLLDRVLYLREDEIDAKMYQVFDRKLSPRNIAIIVD